MKKIWIVLFLFCWMLCPCYALADGFPSLFIRTENGAEVTSKEEYLYCDVSVGNLKGAPAQIKGRGNSTWVNGEKKSYRLKFVHKQNPLNTGRKKERDWVLLANHFDKSLLRNCAALLLASRLDGLEASIRFQNVHLYVNDEYRGVYLLCEHIEADGCGLEIDESEGFLLEMDAYAGGEGTFVVGDKTYVMQSEYRSQEQLDEIYSYIDNLDTAIMQGEEQYIREAMDMDSWIDAYLVEEFLMNTDVGFSSFYVYRTDANAKLQAGPLWDFDLSAGNHAETNGGSFQGFYAAELQGTLSDHQWFSWLMEMKWFSDAVCARWKEISGIIDGVIQDVERMAKEHEDDYARNFQRWPVLHTKIWKDPDALMEMDTQAEHAAYLIDWMRARKEWLDEAFENRRAEMAEMEGPAP